MNAQSLWQWTKSGGKAGFNKFNSLIDKHVSSFGKEPQKVGPETFWPGSLDQESEKAAKILKSFCHDGFYEEAVHSTPGGNTEKDLTLRKIPASVIQNAQGLAIFTIMRNGLWISGSGGSGVLVARTNDGSWSLPSAISVQTMGLGFSVGVDIYDCIIVVNSAEALRSFKKARNTLGQDVSAASGIVSVRASMEMDWHVDQAPVFTYLKSRGYHSEVEMDGTVILERVDENERFYGTKIVAKDIFAGKTRWTSTAFRALTHTLKAAQRDRDADITALPEGAPPGDFEIEENGRVFGVPDQSDLDPYGVLALEQQGLEIREAGSQNKPSSEAFDFRPNPTSPIYDAFSRRSIDGRSIRTASERNSWRASNYSTERAIQPPEAQTRLEQNKPTVDEAQSNLVTDRQTSLSPKNIISTSRTSLEGRISNFSPKMVEDLNPHPISSRNSLEAVEEGIKDSSRDGSSPIHPLTPTIKLEQAPETADEELNRVSRSSLMASIENSVNDDEDDDDDDDDEFEDVEEPVIEEIQQASSPQVVTKARLVTVNKPLPPKLPPRNPRRKPSTIDAKFANSDRSIGEKGAASSPASTTSGYASSVQSISSRRPSSGESKESASSVDAIDGLAERIAKLAPHMRNGHGSHKVGTDSPDDREEFHSVPGTPGRSVG